VDKTRRKKETRGKQTDKQEEKRKEGGNLFTISSPG
jgi:hypothetical protein